MATFSEEERSGLVIYSHPMEHLGDYFGKGDTQLPSYKYRGD